MCHDKRSCQSCAPPAGNCSVKSAARRTIAYPSEGCGLGGSIRPATWGRRRDRDPSTAAAPSLTWALSSDAVGWCASGRRVAQAPQRSPLESSNPRPRAVRVRPLVCGAPRRPVFRHTRGHEQSKAMELAAGEQGHRRVAAQRTVDGDVRARARSRAAPITLLA